MSGKIVRLRHSKNVRNATSGAKGRQRNEAYRVRAPDRRHSLISLAFLLVLGCNPPARTRQDWEGDCRGQFPGVTNK
jgi:hypothetical protein